MLKIDQELQQGRYRIVSQIKQEQMIPLFEIYDKVLAKSFLLKEISVETNSDGNLLSNEAQNNAFDEKSKFLSEIKNEGFLQILDHFIEGDARYLVIESADGSNVGEIIKNSNKLVSPANVLDWGKQILDALDFLHKKTPAVLYFNLKPTNLFLTSDEKDQTSCDGNFRDKRFKRKN